MRAGCSLGLSGGGRRLGRRRRSRRRALLVALQALAILRLQLQAGLLRDADPLVGDIVNAAAEVDLKRELKKE